MEQGTGLFIALLFLLLYFLSTRPKKRKTHSPNGPMERKVELAKRTKQEPPPVIREKTPTLATGNEISHIEKKKTSPLQSGWKKKSSIRQAILLSEILKGPYEHL